MPSANSLTCAILGSMYWEWDWELCSLIRWLSGMLSLRKISTNCSSRPSRLTRAVTSMMMKIKNLHEYGNIGTHLLRIRLLFQLMFRYFPYMFVANLYGSALFWMCGFAYEEISDATTLSNVLFRVFL